ncbi:efflux RND transporter periplasmic adaptor subunit [bacterium]|nr:efflux RND transporter periplasmic adaptor subunit [bacterium]
MTSGIVKQTLTKLKLPVLILLTFSVGFLLRGGNKNQSQYPVINTTANEQETQIWTCSMHPQIRQNHPGQCPICGMDLIPVTTEHAEEGLGPRELKLSPRAVKLAEVQVAPVERRSVTKDIRLIGKVDYDETRVRTISAWFSGRIDRLYIDFTGTPVSKGNRLADLYSPDLYNAQQEFLQSLKAAGQFRQASLSSTGELTLRAVDAAREKLRLLGMTSEQIGEFERSGTPSEHVTISSTMDGVVIHKNAVEGTYIATGTPLYTIADLSQVWVKLDVYESDLGSIRLGQEMEFTADAYPGEVFKGKIVFIDPVLDNKTRTVKVRVNVPNPAGRLKPEMFVHAIVKSPLYSAGRSSAPPLVIPASAPLVTGKRAVVYIEVPGREATYEGREIVLGPRAGNYYIVKEGLLEGERVVVNGNFKIDSALQILAKPSMMNPEGGLAPAHDHGQTPAVQAAIQMAGGSGAQMKHEETAKQESGPLKEPEPFAVPDQFKAQLDSVYASYFRIQYALSHDSLEGAHKAGATFLGALGTVNMELLKDKAHMAWMDELNNLKKNGDAVSKAGTIEIARAAFEPLSAVMIRVAHRFGTTGRVAVYRFHCPMAFNNKGADWLQGKTDLENPWFGSSMLKCGSLEETISEGPGETGRKK